MAERGQKDTSYPPNQLKVINCSAVDLHPEASGLRLYRRIVSSIQSRRPLTVWQPKNLESCEASVISGQIPTTRSNSDDPNAASARSPLGRRGVSKIINKAPGQARDTTNKLARNQSRRQSVNKFSIDFLNCWGISAPQDFPKGVAHQRACQGRRGRSFPHRTRPDVGSINIHTENSAAGCIELRAQIALNYYGPSRRHPGGGC